MNCLRFLICRGGIFDCPALGEQFLRVPATLLLLDMYVQWNLVNWTPHGTGQKWSVTRGGPFNEVFNTRNLQLGAEESGPIPEVVR